MEGIINNKYTRVIIWILIIIFLGILLFNKYMVDFFYSYLLLYRYSMLFVLVFFAGFVIPIPINVLLMGVGALSIQNIFDFNTVLLVATIANAAGDTSAYLVFRKYGHAILRDEYMAKYSFFLRLEEFFKSYTSISITVSRLVGVFGTPVNFLSGYMKTPFWQFVAFDLVGNTIFVLIFLEIGFLVGDKWLRVSDIVGTVMNAIAIFMLVFLGFMLFFRKPEKDQTLL